MIIKSELKGNFTIISNEIIRNKDLSNNAKLMAVLLASLPKSWKCNTAHLAKEANMGLRTTQNAIKELIDFNFIKKIQGVDEKNKFSKFYSVIFVDNDFEEYEEKISTEEQEEILKNLDEEKEEFTQEKNKNFKANQEEEKQALNTDKNDTLENKALFLTDSSEVKKQELSKNGTLNPTQNSRLAGNFRTYINKEFLQSKNLYGYSILDKNVFIFFKGNKEKSINIDFSGFSELEIEKIKEFFEYRKSMKKPLNIYSKNSLVKKCLEFKGKGLSIVKMIDTAILKGWQGLWVIEKTKNESLNQNEILNLVLEQESEFNFRSDFDLSRVKIAGKVVSYDENKDLFILS
ncbi:hypothetical protein [Campylobacter sp. VTCC 70190]|uniref:hypothetical protein n=1 Tax=Campylobacter sp. VTCC 70190 TaxID=3392118 RepID=UPI00398EAD17